MPSIISRLKLWRALEGILMPGWPINEASLRVGPVRAMTLLLLRYVGRRGVSEPFHAVFEHSTYYYIAYIPVKSLNFPAGHAAQLEQPAAKYIH